MKQYNSTKIYILLALFLSFNSNAQNIKVFILAGQSNAQGHGDVVPANVNGTLTHFMDNGGATEFGFIQNSDGSWVERNDVWVRYDNENGQFLTGNLTTGFGAENTQIGPELLLGHQLGDYSTDKILIIKTCWGGTSLAVDFRPPSSGGTVGPFYTQMIAEINDAIANIATEFPDYNNETIELAGFCWFQGWNDGEEQAFLDEYEQNLINLIADVRTDLNTPDLPVVIGLTGNGGAVIQNEEDGYVSNLQTQLVPAQIAAANHTGHNNVCYADTRNFWPEYNQSPEPDFIHHWRNNAESYVRIGNELGIKMIELLEGNWTNTPITTVYEASSYGFNYFPKEFVSDDSYGAGYSFYSAVWPFTEQYPGAVNFQTGQGTWVAPVNDEATLPADFYNTIEGGLGWWGDTRFGTEVPKFIMGGVAHSFDAAANGPGTGSGDFTDEGERDWSTAGGKYGAAQLSPNVLWPPDGLNMAQGSNGEMLGYGYHPLPFTEPMSTINGVDWEIGNQCWTLFMNTANFKGPVAFFLPTFWSETIVGNPAYEGLFLDAKPSSPNLQFAQEFSAMPTLVGTDNNGAIYSKMIPPVYPTTTSNTSEIMRDINVYSLDAKWNAVESWFNGGPIAPTSMQSSGSLPVDFDIDNNEAVPVDAGTWTAVGPEVDTLINQESYSAVKESADSKAAFFEWNTNIIDEVSTGFIMPEYYQLNPTGEWEAIAESAVPASTGLLNQEPLTTSINENRPYLTPLEPDCHHFGEPSPWTSAVPAAGPFKVTIGDGTELTYYWYKFIDQPAIIHANLPDAMRTELQRRVELIHTHWQNTDSYLPNPTGGSLVSLDQGLLVTPPAGLEIGYVPIVSRQEYVGTPTTSPVADLEIDANCIQLFPNPNNGFFTIQGDFQNYSIQILSQNGMVFQELTGSESPISIDISALPAGTYFIRVHNTITNQLSFEKVLKF